MSKHIAFDDLVEFWADPDNQELHLQAFTAHLNVLHGTELKPQSVRARLYKIRDIAEEAGFECPPIPKSMNKAGRPKKFKPRVPPAFAKHFTPKGKTE